MSNRGRKFTVVVGIEFGATFSGYAYSLKNNYHTNPLKVCGHLWTTGGHITSSKIPTTILFNPQKEFHSFGYEAEDKYVSLKLAGEHSQWYYFPLFLRASQDISEDGYLKAENGEEMLVLDVYSAAVKYLHSHANEKLKYRLKGVGDDKKCLVMVSRYEKEALYKMAADKAGIRWNVYVINKRTAFMSYFHQWTRCSGRAFIPGPNYLLLDATANRVLLEVLNGNDFQNEGQCVHTATFPGTGSAIINDEIIQLFEEFVGEDSKEKFRQCLDEHLKLEREIEYQKRKLLRESAKPFMLKLSKDDFKKTWNIISKASDQLPSLNVDDNFFQLSTDFFSGLSKDSAENLSSQVYDDLHAVGMHHLSDIIMVGGYSASQFLQSAIQKRFPNTIVHTMVDPGIVELKGAVIYGHSGRFTGSRQIKTQDSCGKCLSRSAEEGPQTVRNLRLVFVGPESVGKSLLAKHLMKEPPPQSEMDKHEALEIQVQKYVVDLDTSELENVSENNDANQKNFDYSEQQYTTSHEAEFAEDSQRDYESSPLNTSLSTNSLQEKKAQISMWIFGGMSSLYYTKHIFLSSDAVYLILFNLVHCIKETESSVSHIIEWVRSIGTHLMNRRRTDMLSTPPVIFVGTHRDQIIGQDKEVGDVIANFYDRLFEEQDFQIVKDHIYGFFELDCTQPDETDIHDLWQAILEVAPAQLQWGKEIPLKWLLIETEIMRIKNSGGNVMTTTDVKDIVKNLRYSLDNPSEIADFLRYLHVAGSVLYFGNDVTEDANSIIADTIILNPQWLINAFQTIIVETKDRRKCNPRMRFLCKMYKKTAVLDVHFLEVLLKELEEPSYVTHMDVIIAFMKRFALIAKPYSVTTTQSWERETLIVPSMLSDVSPLVLPDEVFHRFTVKTPTLCLVFRNRFVSQQVLDQLMAAFIENHELKKINQKTFLQRRCGIFSVDGLWSVIVCLAQGIVKLTMYKHSPSKKIPAGIGLNIRLLVQDYLKKDLLYDYHLHCHAHCDERQVTIAVKDVLEKRSLPCCEGNSKHFFTMKDTNAWFSEPTYQEAEEEDIDLPFSSKVLDRTPTKRELGRVSQFLGREYQLFFVELGLEIVEINQIELELSAVSQSTRYLHMFDKWACRYQDRATIREIVKAMFRHGMDIVSLVDNNVFED